MAKLSAFTKGNLNKQGFESLDDEAKSRYALPLRFTPAVALILIVVGLALRSPIWLGAMSLVALSGALFPRWMILDLVYNLVVRHLFHAQVLPATPPPRRFSYVLSTVFLAASALSFHFGWAVLGFILGGMVAIGATILATSLWCLGSWFYRLSFKHAAASVDLHPDLDERCKGNHLPHAKRDGVTHMDDAAHAAAHASTLPDRRLG